MKLPPLLRNALVGLITNHYLRDPKRRHEVAHLLDRATPWGIAREFLAQLCYRTGSARSWVTPRAVRFEVTNHCNLKCVMCPQPETMARRKENLDFDTYCRFLDANPGIEEVDLFNWGEPLLHPRILDFVRYASQRGIYTRMVSNAVILEGKRAEGLIDAGISAIFFSFDGVGEDFHRIRGIAIDRPLNNVKAFLELCKKKGRKVFTGVNVTQSAWNRETAESAAETFRALGVDHVELQLCEEYSPDYKRQVPCFEPYRYGVVLSNGDMVPCCVDYDGELAFGSIKSEPELAKIYNSRKARTLRAGLQSPGTMPNVCSHCTFKLPRSLRPTP